MNLNRPEILFPLFAPVSSLPGIGKKLENSLENKIGNRVIDLLFHMPIHTIDRTITKNLSEKNSNSLVTIEIKVNKHFPAFYKSKKPYKVSAYSFITPVDIIFFNARNEYIKNLLPENHNFIISGKIDWYNNKAQIINPEYIFPIDKKNELPKIEPVYPLFSNINTKVIIKAISYALELVPKNFPEWIPIQSIEKHKFPTFLESLYSVHKPKNNNDILPTSVFRKRLAFDEIFANQLVFYLFKINQNIRKKNPKNINFK